MQGGMVSGGEAADTKGSAQQWKVANGNYCALHYAVLLAGEVCLNIGSKISQPRDIEIQF